MLPVYVTTENYRGTWPGLGGGWNLGGKFKMKYNNGRIELGVSFFSILSENHFFFAKHDS